MKAYREEWCVWSTNIQHMGLELFFAGLLEAFAPLTYVGAQCAHIGRPILSLFVPENQIDATIELLEDCSNTQAFIQQLREKNRP